MSAVVHNLKPDPATAKIELRDVCLSYFTPEGETEALSQVSFALAPGEFVSLIGQSGCGKSTLLSLIAGLHAPTSGTVMIDGQAVTEPNPRIGYMLQQDYLFEWRTILDNVMLAPRSRAGAMRAARPGPCTCWKSAGWARSCRTRHASCRAACASARRWRARW